jgi:hypothetical protein
MISLDWKERLIKDTEDFYTRKLSKGDFDIDIVYNAYPQRIDNKIPQAVITLVGKTLAAKLAKTADQYFDFYDYLMANKGEQGIIIFSYLMARAVKKKPEIFLQYLEKILLSCEEQKICNLIVDKALHPLIKKDPVKYLDLLNGWIKKDNQHLSLSIQKLLIKLIHRDASLIKPIFDKLESSWLYATPTMVKLNYHLLKEIYKSDKDFYLAVYKNYQNTRNPVFAEILSDAICVKDPVIEKMVDLWSHSGNIKLKKIGIHSQKILKKKVRK